MLIKTQFTDSIYIKLKSCIIQIMPFFIYDSNTVIVRMYVLLSLKNVCFLLCVAI